MNGQKGLWFVIVAWGLIFTPAFAAKTEEKAPKGWFERAKTDLAHLPADVFDGSKDTFLRRDNMAALFLAGGASIAMDKSNADDKIARNFECHRSFRGFRDETFYIVGGPGFHFAAAGLWYAISAEKPDELNRERAWTMIKALSVTSLTTTGLKAAVDNETPNHKRWAWPSGHISSSFTAASVLDEFYGPGVGIPTYGLASVVAWRMMDTGDHWASDIVFGATLGWVVGHGVAGKYKVPEMAGFEILPYASADGDSVTGVMLVKQF